MVLLIVVRTVLGQLCLHRLFQFVTLKSYNFEVTFRAVLYKKQLVKKLEDLNWEESTFETCSAIHELLIYMNFNSKTYIKLLTGDILKLVQQHVGIGEKIDQLNFYQKAFNQVHPRPDTILNPGYHDLHMIIDNWFSQEIAYLEKKLALPLPTEEEAKPPVEKTGNLQTVKQKITCMLSSDQMGLIIRGADESRVVVAKSMSQVFRTLVPFLSSPHKRELSYDGMRSKSYVAEEKDKEAAIHALERIIKKIQGY